MYFRGFIAVITLFLNNTSNAQMAVSEQDGKKLTFGIEYLQKINSNVCSVEFDPMLFAKKMKCSELFSSQQPDWSKENKMEWFPFCSYYFENKIQFENQVQSNFSIFKKLESKIQDLDTCMEKHTSAPIENRHGKGYNPPSQKDADVRPMNNLERKNLVKIAHQSIKSISDSCCNKVEACLKFFRGIQIKLCRVKSNPDVSDPCLDDGDSYNNGESPDLLSLESGTLGLAPFVGDNYDMIEATLAHELGHACSSIQRQIAARKQDVAALNDLRKEDRGDCVNDSDTKNIYSKLFTQLGYSSESGKCVDNVADGAVQNRFGTGVCEAACPLMQMEEAYAEFHSATVLTVSNFIPEFLPGNCRMQKDSYHPLELDIISCMIKTPSMLEKFESAVGCQP